MEAININEMQSISGLDGKKREEYFGSPDSVWEVESFSRRGDVANKIDVKIDFDNIWHPGYKGQMEINGEVFYAFPDDPIFIPSYSQGWFKAFLPNQKALPNIDFLIEYCDNQHNGMCIVRAIRNSRGKFEEFDCIKYIETGKNNREIILTEVFKDDYIILIKPNGCLEKWKLDTEHDYAGFELVGTINTSSKSRYIIYNKEELIYACPHSLIDCNQMKIQTNEKLKDNDIGQNKMWKLSKNAEEEVFFLRTVQGKLALVKIANKKLEANVFEIKDLPIDPKFILPINDEQALLCSGNGILFDVRKNNSSGRYSTHSERMIKDRVWKKPEFDPDWPKYDDLEGYYETYALEYCLIYEPERILLIKSDELYDYHYFKY